jgi:hypothetical protein
VHELGAKQLRRQGSVDRSSGGKGGVVQDSSQSLRPVQWHCPTPRPFGEDEQTKFGSLALAVAIWHDQQRGPDDIFGLELRQSYRTLERRDAGELALPDFVETKLRRLFLRPAIEPILASYRTILTSDTISVEDAVDLASALSSRSVDFRTGWMSGEANGRVALFERSVDPRADLARLCSEDLAGIGDAAPFYLFAKIIALHPFRDGNGRFARAMAAGGLARRTGTFRLMMPLAPAFYLAAPEIARGLEAACLGGGWSAFYRAMLDACADAVVLAWDGRNQNHPC